MCSNTRGPFGAAPFLVLGIRSLGPHDTIASSFLARGELGGEGGFGGGGLGLGPYDTIGYSELSGWLYSVVLLASRVLGFWGSGLFVRGSLPGIHLLPEPPGRRVRARAFSYRRAGLWAGPT